MGQSKPSATVTDLITADVAVYGDDNGPTMGPQWSQLSIADILSRNPRLAAEMTRVGYSGRVYVDSQTGEVLIANRGTANELNVETDGLIALQLQNNAQHVADDFARAGLQAAQERFRREHVAMSALYFTGHSLGGALAQGQTATLSREHLPDGTPLVPKDVRITSLAIDAPGIGKLANTGDQGRYASYNISTQGDLVHLAGGDQLAGTVEATLPIGPSRFETGGLMIGGALIAEELPSAGARIALRGTENALAAHRSALILSNVSGTVLGDTKAAELGTSECVLSEAFAQRSKKADSVTVQAESRAQTANENRHAPASEDLNHIWGIDGSGNVDQSALKGSGANVVYAEQWLDTHGYDQKARVQYKNGNG